MTDNILYDKVMKLVEENFTGSSHLATVLIDEQGMVSAREHIRLQNRNLTRLPVTFKHIGGYDLWLGSSDLQTLEGCPPTMQSALIINDCRNLTSLVGAPTSLTKLFADGTMLKSLEGIPQQMQVLDLTVLPDTGVLRLCLVKDLRSVYLREEQIGAEIEDLTDIIDRYCGKGPSVLSACATELIKAGYRGNARL